MAKLLRIWDTTLPGERVVGFVTNLPEGAATTVGPLVRARVKEDVRRFNAKLPEVFQGLVQPEESERLRNGFRMREKKPGRDFAQGVSLGERRQNQGRDHYAATLECGSRRADPVLD